MSMLFPWMWLRSTGFPFHWLDELAEPSLPDPGAFERHVRASRRRLAELLNRPDTTDALLLSNTDAIDRMAALATADLDRPNVRTRQRIRLAWSYLQRFCAKNETVSFFGPLAWGTLDPSLPHAISLAARDPDAGWLHRRHVQVEHWVVHRLCAQVSLTHADRLPYRLHAGCDLDGEHLRVPFGRRVRLTAPAESAHDSLVKAGVLVRGVQVAPQTAEPLRRIEEAVGEALPVTARLEELRARFERETGRAERARTLADMRELLQRHGVDTTRAAGANYVGRLPVYEDCERNLRFRIGGRLAGILTGQLPELLRRYRVVAQCVAGALHEHYESVHSPDFMVTLKAVRSPEMGRVRRAIEERVRSRLSDLDAAFPGHRRFAGVLGVGVVSPDVMVAAQSPAAMDRGELTVILGEVHPGVLTALQPVALPFLGAQELAGALALADRVCGHRIVLAASDEVYQRSYIAWPVTPNFHEVVIPGSTSRCPPSRQIPAGRGRVESRDGLLHFVDRATGMADDLVTVLSSDLQHIMFALAGDVLEGVGGDIVLRRKRFTFATGEVPEATRAGEHFGDYQRLRRWALERGLPRRCFARTDTETKPVYVDWANPISVDVFAKLARSGTHMEISEMMPGPGELWLADDSGLHTAELRMSYLV